MTIEWVLGIVAALFGGLNIFQIIFWKSEKQKVEADAGLRWKDLVSELKEEVRKSYAESIEAQNLRNEDNEKHLNEISGLRIEIVNLKEEIASLKREIETMRAEAVKPEPKPKKKSSKKEDPKE